MTTALEPAVRWESPQEEENRLQAFKKKLEHETVDGRNPAPVHNIMVSKGSKGKYPIIYRVIWVCMYISINQQVQDSLIIRIKGIGISIMNVCKEKESWNTLEHVFTSPSAEDIWRLPNAEHVFRISYAFQSSREFGEVWSARPNVWFLRLMRWGCETVDFCRTPFLGDFEDPSVFTAKSCKIKDQSCEIFEVLLMGCICTYSSVLVVTGSQIKTTFMEGHVPLGMGQEYKLHLTAVVSTLALTLIEA